MGHVPREDNQARSGLEEFLCTSREACGVLACQLGILWRQKATIVREPRQCVIMNASARSLQEGLYFAEATWMDKWLVVPAASIRPPTELEANSH